MRVISGSARGIALKTPDGYITRPTADRVKEALFSILQFDLPGSRVLDLFGGTGQLGIEALSRGAASAVFVDENEKACRLISENLSRTSLASKACVIRSDFSVFLKKCKNRFDIILIDPPFGEDLWENVLKLITEIDILESSGIIVAERPVNKQLNGILPDNFTCKDYKYGNTALTIFRKL